MKLSGPRQGRIGIVIDVPSGSTAYQASDRRYYGRAEYECIPLQDHEVRLRIMRGRVAAARMEVGKVECIPYGKALIFYFDLILVNVGEITITDLLLSLQVESNVRLLAPVGDQIPGSSPLTYRLREGLGRHDEREEGGFLHWRTLIIRSSRNSEYSFHEVGGKSRTWAKSQFPKRRSHFPGLYIWTIPPRPKAS